MIYTKPGTYLQIGFRKSTRISELGTKCAWVSNANEMFIVKSKIIQILSKSEFWRWFVSLPRFIPKCPRNLTLSFEFSLDTRSHSVNHWTQQKIHWQRQRLVNDTVTTCIVIQLNTYLNRLWWSFVQFRWFAKWTSWNPIHPPASMCCNYFIKYSN